MEEVRQLFYDYVSLFAGNAGVASIEIIVVTLLARLLGATGFGTYSLFFVIVQLILLFGVVWIGAGIVRFGKEEAIKEDCLRKTFGAALVVICAIFSLLLPTLFLLREHINSYIGLLEDGATLLIGAIFVGTFVRILPSFFQAVGKMKQMALLPLIGSTLLLSSVLLMTMGLIPSQVTTIISLYILTNAITAAIAVILLARWVFPLRLCFAWLRKIVSFSLPMMLGGISTYVLDYVDLIIGKMFLPLSSIGMYALAYRFEEYLYFTASLSVTLTFPLMTRWLVTGQEHHIRNYLDRTVPQAIFLWGMGLSLIMVLSDVGLQMLLGDQYTAVASAFVVLIVAVLFRGFAVCYSPVLTAYGFLKQLVGISVLMGLANITLDFVLIPRLGIMGAAVATAMTYAIALLEIYIINTNLRIRHYSPLLCAIPALIMTAISLSVDRLWLRLIALIMVMLGSIMVVKRHNLFRPEDVEVFQQIQMPEAIRRSISKVYYALSG